MHWMEIDVFMHDIVIDTLENLASCVVFSLNLSVLCNFSCWFVTFFVPCQQNLICYQMSITDLSESRLIKKACLDYKKTPLDQLRAYHVRAMLLENISEISCFRRFFCALPFYECADNKEGKSFLSQKKVWNQTLS